MSRIDPPSAGKMIPPTNALAADEAAFVAEALRAEAAAITAIADGLDGSGAQLAWGAAITLIESCSGHLVVSGMGKSGLIGAKLSATFSSLGQPSHVVHPAEAVHGDLGSIRRGDVVMLLSHSGTTEEVTNLAAILRADDVPTIGISARDDSELAGLTTVHLAVGDVAEACPLNLAPTASTTGALAIGDALALAVSRRRNFSADDFHLAHPGGMLGVGLRHVTDVIRFKVGENLTVVNGKSTVADALNAARPIPDSDGRIRRRAGAVLVHDDNGCLSGIFTDGDLRRLVVSGEPFLEKDVADVMTAVPHRLTTDALVREARSLVLEHRIDEIPIVDHDGKPVGLIDVQDLIALKVVTE
jgi:arabinose-5-phosphate isomerase